MHPDIQAGSPRRLCLSLHFPTLQYCIALHDPSLQCIVPEIYIAPRFPYITLPYIAPNFESTGLIFVLGSCLNCSAMHSRMQCNALPLPCQQCNAWRSKYIPIPQPGQCSAARLKAVPGFTASKLPSSPTHRLIYLYAGTFFGFRQIQPQTKAFLCLPRNKVIVSSLRWLFK